MTNSLLDHLRSAFTSPAVSDLARELKETPAATQKAVDSLLPTVTSGIASYASTTDGADKLHRLLTDTPIDTDPSMEQLVETDSHRQKAAESGNDMLKKLYGERVHQVSEETAKYSGVSLGSATTLTGLVTSVLLGYLYKNGTDKAQMAPLLRTGYEPARSAVPAALAGPLAWFIGTVTPVAGTPVSGMPTPGVVEAVPAAILADEDKGGFPWLRWLLILLGLLLVGWLLTRACDNDKTDATTAVVPADTMGVDVATDAMPKVRVAVDVPGGRQLMLVDSSFNYQLAQYLATSGSEPNRVFFFDDLTFPLNTDRLDESAREEVDNLAEIMKAYPNLEIKIVGHTDDQGPASINQPLSEARAEAVKAALVERSINAGRMTTKKAGETEPIATNATPQGRQANRRVDIIVTKL